MCIPAHLIESRVYPIQLGVKLFCFIVRHPGSHPRSDLQSRGNNGRSANIAILVLRKTAERATTYTVDLGFGVVVVRDAPARVCALCGDASFSDTAVEALGTIVEKVRQYHQELALTRWPDLVA
jgi:hypothetical protein